MGTREWAPGTPEYLYHVYDDAVVTAAFTKGHKTDVVGLGGPPSTDPKWVFSLKKDMDALRTAGAAKGIVDSASVSLGKAPPDNNDLMVLKVGKGSDHPILFAGCHHAREWISVEIPYLVAEYLICNYTDTPSKPQEKRIKHLLSNRQIWFVPLVNPNGHRYTFKRDRMWRPNRKAYKTPSADLPSTQPPALPLMAPQYDGSPDVAIRYPDGKIFTGVDVNRNYPVPAGHSGTWGKETTGTRLDPRKSDTNSVWCGPKAGSEVETRIMANLMSSNKFKATITYHNFWEVIFYSDDCVGDPFVVDFVGKGMQTLIASVGHPYALQNNSSTWDPGNYLTTGELVDYADSVSPKRPAYTPELRPTLDNNAWGFNRLPESEIEPCFLENLPAALALINCAGFDSAPTNPSVTQTTATPPSRCQVVRHGWKVFAGWEPMPSKW
jgi:hypothetical protein